jgi:hypothetical protein
MGWKLADAVQGKIDKTLGGSGSWRDIQVEFDAFDGAKCYNVTCSL